MPFQQRRKPLLRMMMLLVVTLICCQLVPICQSAPAMMKQPTDESSMSIDKKAKVGYGLGVESPSELANYLMQLHSALALAGRPRFGKRSAIKSVPGKAYNYHSSKFSCKWLFCW
ncbi:hypothetical protein BOX15_Mlig016961g1 [Macrostomum lignano]|uniref:Uncharacterized protein n=1 Tax=Macrostomum lignano TaxID=282301 RepID=A0A267E364_9PLAT|nr:hypothetical protein BOX15_Mlig016961g1 [Macrostomum lignano]